MPWQPKNVLLAPVTISPFPYACGCCAPGILLSSRILCGCCAPEYTDTFSFSFLVTLKDAMRSLDVSCIARTWWPSHHVTTDFSESRATGSLTLSLLCGYHFSLMSSFRLSRTTSYLCYPDSLISPVLVTPYVTRTSCLAGFRYAQSSTRFVSPLSLTRLDDILVSYLYGFYACLYLYLSYLYIYWVGDGTIPIFNLLCNHPSVVTCEIPRTLARPL